VHLFHPPVTFLGRRGRHLLTVRRRAALAEKVIGTTFTFKIFACGATLPLARSHVIS
jgi:hypothetical protein